MADRLPKELRPALEEARKRLLRARVHSPSPRGRSLVFGDYQMQLLRDAEHELNGLSGSGSRRSRPWPFGQAAYTWSLRASRLMGQLVALLASGLSAEIEDLPEQPPNPFAVQPPDAELSPEQVELYARWIPIAQRHLAYLEDLIGSASERLRHGEGGRAGLPAYVELLQRLTVLTGQTLERAESAARTPADYARGPSDVEDRHAAENSLALLELDLSDAELQLLWSRFAEAIPDDWFQSLGNELGRLQEQEERNMNREFEAFSYIFSNQPGLVCSDGRLLRVEDASRGVTVFQTPVTMIRARCRRLSGAATVWAEGQKYNLWWRGMFYPKSRATTRRFLSFIESHGGRVE